MRTFTLISLCSALIVLSVSCASGTRDGAAESDVDAGRGAAGGPAWQQLRSGMPHTEVLDLLGPPQASDISRLRTFWFYSPQQMDGAFVRFDTSAMTVESWQRP